MRKRRKPINYLRILILLGLIAVVLYFNQEVVPSMGPIGLPSPTPTRSPESFISEAEQFFKEGKILKSVDTYKDAIRNDPNNRENYVKLAILQAIQSVGGNYKDALDTVGLSLVGNNNYAMGYAVKGWILNLAGNYLEADAALKKALELEPKNALAMAYYAEMLINKGEYGDVEKAIQYSRDALSLGQDLYETHRSRGIVLFSTGNYEDAIKEFQNAITLNKNIPDLYSYLGYCYRAIGDYGRSTESFIQANALNPQDPVPDLEISRTYATVGEFSKAVQYAQQAVEEDSANPHRYGNLGLMYYKNQQLKEAIDTLSLAIRGGTSKKGEAIPGLPLDRGRVVQYYFTYGLALARLNRCSEAIPIMQAILSGVPDDEISVYNANEGLNICKQNLETKTPGEGQTGPQGGSPPPPPGQGGDQGQNPPATQNAPPTRSTAEPPPQTPQGNQ